MRARSLSYGIATCPFPLPVSGWQPAMQEFADACESITPLNCGHGAAPRDNDNLK